MYLRNKRGRNLLHLSNPSINRNSVVHISATEATELTPGVLTPIYSRFVGAADIWVKNVAPHDGGVHFILQVDWGSPLDVVMDISVFDPVPMEHTVVGT
jgi:hypothetical protein